MSETQTQTQNPTQQKTTTISIDIDMKPELRHTITSSGYQYMTAKVTVKATLRLNDREIEFEPVTITRTYYLYHDEKDIEEIIEAVAKAKEQLIKRINAFITLREKALSVLRQFGEVEEYF